MGHKAYAVATALLVLLGLVCLFSLRLLGVYNHQSLAVVLLLGLGWAVVSRVWLLRTHGTLRVGEGDRVRKGDRLALAGNSGNTTLPHLHLQVQTHADIWDPDNRSVPFGFEPDGRVLARTGRVGTPVR